MRFYFFFVFTLLSINSISQDISFTANLPFIHEPEINGTIDLNLQFQYYSFQEGTWKLDVKLGYLRFNNELEDASNLINPSLGVEYGFSELGPSLGMQFVADIGYYYQSNHNGLSFGFGVLFDRMINQNTQFLVTIKENLLIDRFNYLNLGIGIRRFL